MIYFSTTKFTDDFPWIDDGSTDIQHKKALFDKIKECLNKTDLNKKIVDILKNYRTIE